MVANHGRHEAWMFSCQSHLLGKFTAQDLESSKGILQRLSLFPSVSVFRQFLHALLDRQFGGINPLPELCEICFHQSGAVELSPTRDGFPYRSDAAVRKNVRTVVDEEGPSSLVP